MTDRRGFTLVELVVVVLVISILAAVAIPNFQRALIRARAAGVAGDLNVVRVAVLNYQADTQLWPADKNRGIIPAELEPYLPDGFSFVSPDATFDYDNWSAKAEKLVGVTVIMTDQELGLALVDMLGVNAWTNGNDKFTWVIQWTG